MKCFRCENHIKIPQECKNCSEKFCSEECLQIHTKIVHQSKTESPIISQSNNNNNSVTNTSQENNLNYQQQSPYFIKGIFNKNEIKYDSLYSLDNLSLIYSKGIPKLIGNGSFGQVYLAQNNINKKSYAIKHMEKDNLLKYLDDLDQIYREIDFQSRINHPNIIQLLYMKETNETFDLVLEYSKYGTLFDFVINCKGLMENLVFKFFIQIVNAIKFLHDNNIIHRDIKPENILLFDNYIVKLCDFGWSIKCESRLPGGSFSGTTEYMAPELINNEDYGKEIDVWMLGILLYELVHGFSPFRPKRQKFEDSEVIDNIRNHEILFYMPTSDEYKELVFNLLETDVNKRYTVDDIFNSNFVKKYEAEEFGINYNNNEDNVGENDFKDINSINSENNNNSDITLEKNEKDNLFKIKKNLLMNRYDNNEEKNDSKRKINNNELNPEYKKQEINKNEIIKDNKQKEEEPNAPRNNKRNKNKNKVINPKNTKLNLDLNRLNKKENQIQKNSLTNSTKNYNNFNEKNEYMKQNLNLIFPNTIINNNLHTSRYKEKEKRKFDTSEESISIENKQITNVIFHNKEKDNNSTKNIHTNSNNNNNNKESNPILLTKNLTSNQANLSLSLSPKTANYSSLLNQSISPEHKNEITNLNLNNGFILPITESQHLANISNSLKEFPFDHFANNSSLDIHKPIFNNKMMKNKKKINIQKKEEVIISGVKEKEPNDNMRRRNKKIRNEMPMDNIKKKEKDIKPEDNFKKINDSVKSSEIKTISSTYNEKENIDLNNNKINPIAQAISKKIIDNINKKSNQKSSRNYSVSNTNDLSRKTKLNLENINKAHLFKTDGKNRINQKGNIKTLNNNERGTENKINNKILFVEPIKEKIEEIVPIKKLNNNNNYFVVKKNGVKNLLEKNNKNKTEGKNNVKKQNNKNLNDKEIKKGKSVNKYGYLKFNKEGPKPKLNLIKSSKDIKSNKNNLGASKKKSNINIKINKKKKDKNQKLNTTEENKKKKIDNKDNITKIKVEKENYIKDINEKENKDDNNIKTEKNQIKTEQGRESINFLINKENKISKKIIQKDKEIKLAKKDNNNQNQQKLANKIKKSNNLISYKEKEKEQNKINSQMIDKDNVEKTEKNKNIENINNDKPIKSQTFEEKYKDNKSENYIKEKETIDKENKEILKTECNINLKESKVIIENEIIEDKYDNFKVKHISRYEIVSNENITKITNQNTSKQEKSVNKKIISDNLNTENKVENKSIKKNGRAIQKTLKKNNTDNLNSNKKKGNKNILDNNNSKLKLSSKKIAKDIKDVSLSNENISNRIITNKLGQSKNNNIKLNNKGSLNILPKKIGSDSNSSNSSIYEYEKSTNKEEEIDNSNYNINNISKQKLNLSNSESKTTNYSKQQRTNIEKIKALSNNKLDKLSQNHSKSKSQDTKKQHTIKKFQEKSYMNYKVGNLNLLNNNLKKINNPLGNKKEFPNKDMKFNKMHKNKTDGLLNKNISNNKLDSDKKSENENKENLRLNKRINSEKLNNIKNIKNNLTNEKTANLKKKNKKSINKEGKNDINQNEICNDSESYIIDGDSEYGDCQAL